MATIISDDDGYFEVTIKAGGQEITKRLDLYEWHAKINDLAGQFRGADDNLLEWRLAVRKLMKEEGFPDCSLKVGANFVEAIRERVESLKNVPVAPGASTTPASPDSTAPPP